MYQHLAVAEYHFLTDVLTLHFEQDMAYMYPTSTCIDFLHPTMPCAHLFSLLAEVYHDGSKKPLLAGKHLFCKEFCILLTHVSTETLLQ